MARPVRPAPDGRPRILVPARTASASMAEHFLPRRDVHLPSAQGGCYRPPTLARAVPRRRSTLCAHPRFCRVEAWSSPLAGGRRPHRLSTRRRQLLAPTGASSPPSTPLPHRLPRTFYVTQQWASAWSRRRSRRMDNEQATAASEHHVTWVDNARPLCPRDEQPARVMTKTSPRWARYGIRPERRRPGEIPTRHEQAPQPGETRRALAREQPDGARRPHERAAEPDVPAWPPTLRLASGQAVHGG